MASNPVEAYFIEQIGQLGGWEIAVFERLENGETQTQVARSYGISQGFLSRLTNADPERKARMKEVKRAVAQRYADCVAETIEDMPEDKVGIARSREQIDGWKWLAKVNDREEFGDSQAVTNPVQINIGELHLAAIKPKVVPLTASVPELPPRAGNNTITTLPASSDSELSKPRSDS